MSKEFHQKLSRLDNVYLVRCDKPRDLEFNQFDDLIDKADIVVSMCHTSTTIWQAFAKNKPAIAVNDVHPKTLLSRYKCIESDLGGLEEALHFWHGSTLESCERVINQIKADFNIGQSNGLHEIALDLISEVHFQKTYGSFD